VNWAGVTSLVTAATAVGALVFTGLSLNATRDQVSIAEQGQFTDRFSRAVDQLGQQGPDRLQVRLGGIYSLERLAGDSPRDHGTIVEVLAAFVRSTASVFLHGKYVGCASTALDAPTTDIQAAVSVIGRLGLARDATTGADLSDSCLRGADLSDANLTNVTLVDADLVDANLEGANLTGAYLFHANLSGAELIEVDLRGANLVDTWHDSTTIDSVVTDAGTRGAWWFSS
jgi:hypothetical protein